MTADIKTAKGMEVKNTINKMSFIYNLYKLYALVGSIVAVVTQAK